MKLKNSSWALLLRVGLMVGSAAAMGLAFWQPLQDQERLHYQQVTNLCLRNVLADISDEMWSRMLAQARLANLWSLDERLSQKEWETQAKLFMTHFPGYVAVQWVDAAYHVRRQATEVDGDAHRIAPLATDSRLRSVLEALVSSGEREAVFTPPFRLWSGKAGRGVVVPIYRRQSFLGYVIAIFDEETVFEKILLNHAELGYVVAVFENKEEVYRTPGGTSENEKEWGQDTEFNHPGATWRLRVWPKPQLLGKIESRLPKLALLTGSLIGLLLFLTVDFARAEYRTAQALRDSRGRLFELISSALDAIISVDENQRIVVFNQAAERIFRCRSSETIGQPINKFIPEKFREVHRQHIQNFGHTGVSRRSINSPGTLLGVRADGEEFPIEASISQTRKATRKLYTVILRDISLRVQAEEELRRAHDELESRVQERTAELQSTNKKLEVEVHERRQAEESLRELTGRLLQLRDEEQRRIARDLHDSTAQILGALAIDLERVQQLVPKGNSLKVRKLLAQCSELAERATSEIRTLSYLLHPPILDDLGLECVLPWYAAGFSSRSGIQANVDVQPNLGRFPQEVELTLFRIVQEALTNIHRHSGSPSADITVFRDANQVTLQIEDHGCGISPEILGPLAGARTLVGVGIPGMRERVRQFGGSLEIASGGNGTTIKTILPTDCPSQISDRDYNPRDTCEEQAIQEIPSTGD
jgi:PAS domain S-box-containing protein